MRPRHKAAENDSLSLLLTGALLASMRPRHKAAENMFVVEPAPSTIWSFNEAAA